MTLSRVVLPLRAALVVLFAVLVVLQVLSAPGQFRDEGDLRWPLTAVAVLLVLCAQVVIVATWRLLGLVEADRIFSDVAFRWVDAIVRAVATAWVVLLGLSAAVGTRVDDPAPVLLLLLALAGVAVVWLLMVVMRALLRQATALRTDLEAVI